MTADVRAKFQKLVAAKKRKPAAVASTEIDRDPDLIKMNERFAVVLHSGKTRVVYFEDAGRGYELPVFQAIRDFTSFHDKHRKTIQLARGTQELGLGTWWIRHPDRKQYEVIGYFPNDEDPTRLNLWRGFSCSPEGGDCSLYLAHVRENICRGNDEHLAYALDWMAHGVQRPQEPAGTAIILRGDEGTGKGTFAQGYGKLFGPHFRHLTKERHLVGNFNSHLQMCSVVYADEAFFAGDLRHESALKTLISEDTIVIEPKGVDSFEARNCIHLIMASNSDWVVPAGQDARRFFVLDVADTQKQKNDYFAAIEAQMQNGGRAALLWELLNRDISSFEIRRVPQTSALAEQKQYSRRGVDRLIETLAHRGWLPNVNAINPNIAVTSGEERGRGFYPSARQLAPDLKHRSSPVIARELRQIWGCEMCKGRDPSKAGHYRGIEFKPLADVRARFDKRHGPQEWNDATEWGFEFEDERDQAESYVPPTGDEFEP